MSTQLDPAGPAAAESSIACRGIRLWRSLLFAPALMLFFSHPSTAQVNIYVTTVAPGVTGLCSLQEAIYASELKSSAAIQQTSLSTLDSTYTTQCVPGTGNGDTIVLPTGAVFNFNQAWNGDAHNAYGATATPIIFSNITIEGNGSTLQWVGGPGNARLFTIGTVNDPGFPSGTGNLVLKDIYIKGFHVKGGDGGELGGGGGLGAGGAIFNAGQLTVENSTFDSNGAVGGNGSHCTISFTDCFEEGISGGGGGGLSGNGGDASYFAGGGGGGAFGNGGKGGNGLPGSVSTAPGGGGGGGGTASDGADGQGNGLGGYRCGGNGGGIGNDGQGGCNGGGGGGGGGESGTYGNGATGGYGGGGGGGVANGGNGGFGGGGGAGAGGQFSLLGGNGGFGGGGGAILGSALLKSDPGSGGPFGGNATLFNGGGGGALGGAIFNENGVLKVQNSTFVNNYVTRGQGGAPNTDNGADAGGAIFSHDNVLQVMDSTFSANQSTGSGAAIVMYSDETDTTPVNFEIQNTIIADNGPNECFYTGNNVNFDQSAGNLITSNGTGASFLLGNFNPCPGVVTTIDPSLGSLRVNPPGLLPTMAITTASSAFNAADPSTSLLEDERGIDRPQDGFPDIGAYELCLANPVLAFGCETVVKKQPPTTTMLTVQSSLSAGGTISPAPGSYAVPLDTVSLITATPNLGYCFQSWTGNVTLPSSASTTVIMNQAQGITANFVQCDFALSAATLTAAVDSTATSTIAVKSLGIFNSPVSLSVAGQPAGVSASINPMSVAPGQGASIGSALNVTLGPAVIPETFSLTVTGVSGALTHASLVAVTITATNASTVNVVNALQTARCIDPVAVGKVLDNELALAQAFVNAKQTSLAVDAYGAMLIEIQLLAATKVMPSTCTFGGVSFNPSSVLIADVRDLMGNLKAGTAPSPITGYVVNSSGLGLATATVTLLNSANAVVATAKTDITGFYFFPTTGVLSTGSNYTVQVTGFPLRLSTSSPASQPFTWMGTALELANFVLN